MKLCMRKRRRGVFPAGSALLLGLWGVGCSKTALDSHADSVALTASKGVRADSGAVPMLISDYPLTKRRVAAWRGAQRSLSAVPDDTTLVPVRVDQDVSSAEVDRIVAYLEQRPDSRRAIEQSGLSIRDYVLTALALERAERVRTRTAGADDKARSDANVALATEYAGDLRAARRSAGLHIIDYDDDEDDDDEGNLAVGGRRDAGRAHGHRHGKHKGKGKEKH